MNTKIRINVFDTTTTEPNSNNRKFENKNLDYYPYNNTNKDNQNSGCLHDSCPECGGTGIKKNGGVCIHHIACFCPKCCPTY